MGILGKETNRGRRAIGLVVAVTATAVLLVAAAPTSAETTAITVSPGSTEALSETGTTSVTYTIEQTGTDSLDDVTVSVSGQTGDVSLSATSVALSNNTPSGTITVTAVNDDIYESGGSETINLSFTSSVNVSVSGGSRQVTVADNDPIPTVIGIASVTKAEGNAGSTPFNFTVTLSNPSSATFDVNYQTVPNTALASDFAGGAPPTGTITFPALQTTKDVVINVLGDTAVEAAELPCSTAINPDTGCETFFVNAGGKQAKGTIVNDDQPPAAPTVSIEDLPVNESVGTAVVIVRLSSAAGANVTVSATTSDASAAAPGDYAAAATVPVTILAGETTGELWIPITNDSLDENTETFTVTLSGPINATIADGTATVTITDNDANSRLDVSDASSVNEPGTGGTINAVFNVTLSQASARTVTVPYNTVAGTASAGSDFTAKSGTLTFNPGEALSQQVSVTVLGDAVNEPNETFTLALGAASGAVVGDGQGLALIVDPSAPPSLTIADGAVDEGAGSISLTVTLSGAATAQTVTVAYATAVGSAGAADFTAKTGTVKFLPGDTTETITIPIANDTLAESDETFTVTLSSPVGATLAKTSATARIVDNDTGPGGTVTPVGTKPPTTTTTPKPPTTTPTPTPVVRTLQVKLLWVKLDGKVDGKARAAIRVSLAQLVNARIVMVQGKRKITSSQFQVKRGNRTIYVVLPAFVKKGKVQLQLVMTTAQGAAKTLRTTVTLKAPVKLTAAQKAAAAKKAAAKKAAAKKAAAAKAAAA